MVPDFFTVRLEVADWGPVLANGEARRWLEAELAGVLTPAVLAPLPKALALDGAVGDWIDARAAESRVMLVRDRDGGALLGLLILAEAAPGEAHLGYLLAERAWGRGVATELVRGLMAEAGPVRWRAGVDAGNPASARVLEKCGFLPEARSPDGATMFVREGGDEVS
ncbi:GNAT family N-acetyltransferase [Halovulum sp. GXIMD14794]